MTPQTSPGSLGTSAAAGEAKRSVPPVQSDDRNAFLRSAVSFPPFRSVSTLFKGRRRCGGNSPRWACWARRAGDSASAPPRERQSVRPH